MRKQRADSAVVIPATTTVGLSAEQYQPRAHNLNKISESDGVIVCEVIRPIQLKIGEVFYSEELPKNLASLVGEEGVSGEESEAEETSAKTGKASKAKSNKGGD